MGNVYNPFVQQGQLVGSLTNGPTPLSSIAYTGVGASSTSQTFPKYAGQLTRSAKKRAITIKNGTDQSITVTGMTFYDSVAGTTTINGAGGSGNQSIAAGGAATFAYSWTPDADAPVDSFQIGLYWSTTAGTQGQVSLWVTESF